MAYVQNMEDENQQANPAQGPVSPAGGGQTVHLAPSSGIGSPGASGTAPAPAKGAGGQFATLQNYVDANQGQAAPLANQITGGIQNQYNNLQGQNQSTLSGIGSDVNSGYTPQDTGVLSAEVANPVSFAANPPNVSSFQKQLNDQYTGPASAEGDSRYQTQLAKVNNAISTGQNLTGTEAGRQQLLAQNEAAPSTSVTGLNEAILSKDPNAQASIESAYKPFSDLTSQLSTGAQGIDTNIGQAQTSAQGANAAANKAIADQTAALNSGVQGELGGAQTTYNNYETDANAIGKMLQSGQLSSVAGVGVDPALAAFETNNINPWVAANGQGQTPTYNFANALPQLATVAAPTLNEAATANDFSTFNALNELNGSPINSPLTGLDPSLAGSFSTPSIPAIDNKAVAGDMYTGLSGLPINLTGVPGGNAAFDQYNAILAALQQYQGIPVTNYPGGPPGTPGNIPIPPITNGSPPTNGGGRAFK